MVDPGDGAARDAARTSATAPEPIHIADPDPRWPERFEHAAAEIRSALGDLVVDIEHVGSTAVPGLAAKPVIDIQVGVDSLDPTDISRIVSALTARGYEYVPELESVFANRRFFRRIRGGHRTHQIHLVRRDDHDWWDRHLALRDWLRSHPDDRERYADLKRRLADIHRDDRTAYTDAKSAFIDEVLARAAAGRSDEDPQLA